MRCPSCGQESLSKDERFCEACGKPLNAGSQNSDKVASPLASVSLPQTSPEISSADHAASTCDPQNAKRGSARWRQLGWAAVAVLLYLSVADAAVETFLSQSPLRWWVAGTAAVYLALCVAVWRFMPKLWRRLSWANQAGFSLIVLVALMSATAWMPGGLEQGLNLFRQPTSIVLAVVSAVVVAFSGIFLARLRFIPLAGKIAAGLLTAYGVLAFLLAVNAGTPYSSLFHGGSQWTRLPSWLQGATVGCLFLVPLALLLEIVTSMLGNTRGTPSKLGFKELRSNPSKSDHPESIASWPVSVAIALSMSIFLSGMRTPADYSGLKSQDGPSAQDQSTYDKRMSMARAWPDAIKGYLDRFPDALINVDALAESLKTPETAFQYVRDKIALEPYPGALKGAQATLVTRGGNDLDRAMLLVFLLDKQGISSKIAHGTLSSQQAATLLQQISTRRDATQLILASMPADQKASDSGASKILQDTAAAQHKQIEEMSEAAFANLQSSLRAAHINVGQDMSNQQVDILRDHSWVQATINDQLVDLDPSFADATFGQKFADATDAFAPDNVDEAKFQKVILRAVADYLQNGVISPREILHAEFKAPDLWGKNIRFAILPTSDAQNADEFQPQLNVNGNVTAGQSFRLKESADPAAADPGSHGSAAGDVGAAVAGIGKHTGGLTENLGDTPGGRASEAGTVSKTSASVLGRLYFEVETLGPHLAPSHSRRTILDRIRKSPDPPSIEEGMSDPRSLSALMIQIWDGSIAVGTVHPLFVAKSTLEWLQMYAALQEKLLGATYLGQNYNPSDLPGPLLSPRLLTFALASGLREHDLQTKSASIMRTYYERPRLLFFRRGFVPGDFADNSAPPAYREGIDLINAPFGFVGDRDASAALAMKWGLSDTALELVFSADQNSFNTFPMMAAASSEHVSVDVLDGDRGGGLSSFSVPAALKNALEEDLSSGKAVLAPERLLRVDAINTYGWWSVEKTTGYAIGKMELGGAQALSEYSVQQTLLVKYPLIAASLVGEIDMCYMAQIASSLSGDTAGGDTGKCVTDACCEALAQLIKIEVGAAPGLLGLSEAKDELSAIEKLLAKFAKQGAKKGVADAARSVCEGD